MAKKRVAQCTTPWASQDPALLAGNGSCAPCNASRYFLEGSSPPLSHRRLRCGTPPREPPSAVSTASPGGAFEGIDAVPGPPARAFPHHFLLSLLPDSRFDLQGQRNFGNALGSGGVGAGRSYADRSLGPLMVETRNCVAPGRMDVFFSVKIEKNSKMFDGDVDSSALIFMYMFSHRHRHRQIFHKRFLMNIVHSLIKILFVEIMHLTLVFHPGSF